MTDNASQNAPLRLKPVGMALSLMLAITYLACIAWGLLTPPSLHMHTAWAPLLPGFRWLTPGGFAIGLIESYFYGWWFAFLYVLFYNRFRN